MLGDKKVSLLAYRNRVDDLEYLENMGCDMSLLVDYNILSYANIHFYNGLIKFLLKYNHNMFLYETYCLRLACYYGNIEIVKYINHGFDNQCYEYAKMNGHDEVMKYISDKYYKDLSLVQVVANETLLDYVIDFTLIVLYFINIFSCRF